MDFPHSKKSWRICGNCEGHGKHEHPAFDNGFTSSEWAAMDHDDRANYLSGSYDVSCAQCAGTGKVFDVDPEKLTPEELLQWRQEQEEERQYQRECAMERMMGA